MVVNALIDCDTVERRSVYWLIWSWMFNTPAGSPAVTLLMLASSEFDADWIEERNVVATSWMEYPGAGIEAKEMVIAE